MCVCVKERRVRGSSLGLGVSGFGVRRRCQRLQARLSGVGFEVLRVMRFGGCRRVSGLGNRPQIPWTQGFGEQTKNLGFCAEFARVCGIDQDFGVGE